jgi:ankyrin repeat protein
LTRAKLPPHLALDIKYGFHDVVKILIIEYSRDINGRDYDDNQIPLHFAPWEGHVDVTRLLLKHDADAEARDNDGCTLPLFGIRREPVGRCSGPSQTGCTPLLLATNYGREEVVQALIEHGAGREARDDNTYTSLILASKGGYLEVVRVYLEHGVDTESWDKLGWRSLTWALGK